MNILHVYPYYRPATGFGGILPVIESTVERLGQRGHSVVVYTTDTGGLDGRITDEPAVHGSGVSVNRLPNLSNWLAANMKIPIPFGLRNKLANNISEFDVVHVHGYSHLLAVLTARAAKRHSIPYVMTPHGSINLPDGVSDGLLRRGFDATLSNSVIDTADAIIALTNDEERRIKEAYPDVDRIEQIPNGIDTSKFSPRNNKIKEFAENHGLTDTFKITFIGRLHYKKGLDIIADVAQQLEDEVVEGKPVEFVIIGKDDGYEEEFRRQIAAHGVENVSILGYVSDREVVLAHAAADLFLLPSYSEGQPVSVLEACAASTAVVISEACSLPEVKEAEAGIVVKNTVSDVTDGLRHIIENPDLRRRQATNARAMVENQFAWDHVIDQLEWLYADVQ